MEDVQALVVRIDGEETKMAEPSWDEVTAGQRDDAEAWCGFCRIYNNHDTDDCPNDPTEDAE